MRQTRLKVDVKAVWQKHANSNTDYLLKLPSERRDKETQIQHSDNRLWIPKMHHKVPVTGYGLPKYMQKHNLCANMILEM